MNTPEPRQVFRPYGFRRSDSIAKLATALSQAQGAIEAAKKDSENPYFKSHYADLASVWEVIRKPFSEAGLAILQFPRSTPNPPNPDPKEEDSGLVEVETVLGDLKRDFNARLLQLQAVGGREKIRHDPELHR